MIQRFLYDALTAGIERVTEDPDIITELFSEVYSLTDSEVEGIKTAWSEKTPFVRHGFPPRDVEVPVYAIVLANENESQTWIGDEVGIIDTEGDEDYGADVKGSIWTHTFQILTYTEHPDLTIYYYEIAKSILLAANSYFIRKDLHDIMISGADLMPDRRYIPEHLFARQITFRCSREFNRTDRESALGKAFQVSGIHVDKSGSSSDVGGVKTLLTSVIGD